MPGRARLPSALAAAALALAGGCAQVRGTAEAPAVVKVELAGVRSFEAAELRERIATQPSEGPLPVPILGPVLHQLELALALPDDPPPPPPRVPIVGPVVRTLRLAVDVEVHPLDPDALAVDRKRIEAWYRERGYYSARVEDVEVTPAGPGRVDVKLTVDEGRPTRVERVEVRGLEGAPEAARAVGELPLRAGDVFTYAAYDGARAAVEAALHRTGWATATVKQAAQVLPDERRAVVTYEVAPGPRLRFGALFVAGSSAVRRDLVRQQAAIEIRPGAWYDERTLARAQARVFDLGVFAGVRVTRGEPDAARGTVPIVVAVREAPFRTLRFGPGVGVDSTRWDARLQGGWTHRNFLGDLRRVSVDLRAGWAWLPTAFGATEQGAVGQLTLDFAQPVVAFGRVDALARVELERGLEQTYAFWSERLRLGAPVRLGARWSFVPTYNVEVYQLSSAVDPDPANPGNSAFQSCTVRSDRSAVCVLSFLEQRLAWDGRDDPVNTRRGLYASVAVQQGFEAFGAGYTYLRFLPELRAFLPLGKDLVVAGRARFGGLVPVAETRDPPYVARFFGGGPASMRGYYTRQFSPLVERAPNEWIPVGANGLADGSLELRYDVGGSWGAAAFLDAASASYFSSSDTEYLKALDPGNAQYAIGVGGRYRTPFGPLRLDVGLRLGDPPAPWTDGRLRNGVPVPGPHREPMAAVHLSLGEAF